MDRAAREAFILANTEPVRPPHVPELVFHLATEAHGLWLKTEEELGVASLPPPFWAFAWAGGQGLARHVLDHPGIVRGRSVLDFATGSGIVAIAACRAGAKTVLAADIDPWAEAACVLNAAANSAPLATTLESQIGKDEWDVVLAGDIFYDKTLTDAVLSWLADLAQRGVLVLVGDPGRSYCPRDMLVERAVYQVPVLRALEDSAVKRTTVWSFGTI